MKAVILLCFVAAASAQFYAPLTYNTQQHYNYVPTTTYNAFPQHYTHHYPATVSYHAKSAGNVEHSVVLNKREAEADPLMVYSGYPAYSAAAAGYTPYVHYQPQQQVKPYFYHQQKPFSYPMYKPSVVAHRKQGVYVDDAASSFNYAAKGHYYANSAGTVHKAKREAEAFHHNMFYNQYQYQPVAYTAAATPYVQQYVVPAQPMKFKTYSNDFVSSKNYAAKGQYHAETEGSVHIAKREAEPYYGYYGNNYYNNYPTAYSYSSAYNSYPAASTYSYGYNRYPYSYYY